MTSAINELYEFCPSCEVPLSYYQFYIEKELGNGKNLIKLLEEMGINCMGCKTHIQNKPMTIIADRMRDMKVIITDDIQIRERGYIVKGNLSLKNVLD